MLRRLTPGDVLELEARDVESYRKQPLADDEVAVWQGEQVWDDR